MSVSQRVFFQRVFLTLVCLSIGVLVSLPATGHVLAAEHVTQHSTIPNAKSCTGANCWWYVKGEQTFSSSDAIVGAYADMDQAQPAIGQNEDHSLAEIAVINPALSSAGCNNCDGLEVGWIVSPNQFNGDQGPHLFIFKTIGGQLNGGSCWILTATACGWHQVSQTRTPGMAVDPTLKSQLYGIEYSKGAWWFNYQNERIGYILASDWPNSRFTQVMEAQWYGEVETFNQPNGDCTMMGNGEYGLKAESAQITNMGLINSKAKQLSAQASPVVSDPLLYGMGNVTSPFNSFHYGGYGTCTDFSTLKPTFGPSGTPVVVQGSWLSADSGDQICAFWDTGGGAPISCAYLNQNHSFTINFTVPTNQSTGQHTVGLEDMYHSTLQDNLTFTVTTNTTTVTVQKVWTGDSNNSAKTTFVPGDAIHYLVQVKNANSTTVTATFKFVASGPAQIFSWSGSVSVPSGTSSYYSPSTIPTNAPIGTYTLTVTVTYNGASSQGSSQFTVTASIPKQWDCSKLSVPAIAFYDGQNFTSPEICFEGSGFLNLSDYGWANRAESINVGVHTGCFYDGANGTGNSWCFSGSFTKSTLGTWNNRIASFQMT